MPLKMPTSPEINVIISMIGVYVGKDDGDSDWNGATWGKAISPVDCIEVEALFKGGLGSFTATKNAIAMNANAITELFDIPAFLLNVWDTHFSARINFTCVLLILEFLSLCVQHIYRLIRLASRTYLEPIGNTLQKPIEGSHPLPVPPTNTILERRKKTRKSLKFSDNFY